MGPNKSGGMAYFSGSAQALRKGLVYLLAVALMGADMVSAYAKESQPPDPSVVASQVKKFGVGKSVKVKLVGGEKLRGHIQEIGGESFTVKLSQGAGERAIPYAQVVEVKDPSPIFWILFGAALVIVIIVAAHH